MDDQYYQPEEEYTLKDLNIQNEQVVKKNALHEWEDLHPLGKIIGLIVSIIITLIFIFFAVQVKPQ